MRKIVSIFFLIIPIFFFGQKTIPVKLDWSELQSQTTITALQINYFSFSGAENISEYGALPVFSTSINLPDELFEIEIDIKEIAADTLLAETSNILTDADLLSEKYFYKIIYEGKQAKLFLLPFKKNRADERLIRLHEFELRVDFVPVENKNVQKTTSVRNYKNNSVLSSGTWFKLGIVKTGVYKINYGNLLEMGLTPELLNVKKIGVFGNYDGMLPEENSTPRFDDLEENAFTFIGGEDGKWNDGDYLLFYARSAIKWKYNPFTGRFDHKNNAYSDTTFYFFSPDQGNNFKITTINSTTSPPTQEMETFVDFAAHDRDIENLIFSGKEWFGERITGDTLERTFVFDFPNLDSREPVYLNFEMAARSSVNSYYQVLANDVAVIDSVKIDKLSVNSSYYAKILNKKVTFFSEKDQIILKVKCLTVEPTLVSWINFLEINVRRELTFPGGQMRFRDPHISAAGNITEFTISEANANLTVWDISSIHRPVDIRYQFQNGKLTFRLPTDSLKEFVVFEHNSYYQPVSISPVANQNLHGISNVNLVVISPPIFLEQANRIAKIHETIDGLASIVVTPQMIYNEFSSGSQDIAAIRDFMKMLRDKGAFGDDHVYLMLFGDGSFDYKNRIHGNTNFVPTYQSDESMKETASFVTDDFFGLLDENEGSNSVGNLDVGIGRLPVATVEEATNVVNKIEHYMSRTDEVTGSWRNTFCFIADDMDVNLHLDQANSLINIADTLHAGIHINKIFADAYKKEKVPGGTRFPDVNVQIKKQVDQGALIVNYTGHGGLIALAKEVILDVPTIRAFENIDNMPLFITATCEFSRFDNPEFVSAGEYLFLNKNGGGIALMTTTREAFAHANIVVNRRFYQNLMVTDKGKIPRLGDLVRVSKIPSNANYLNFVLLGDPALRLAFPENEVVTETINNNTVSGQADTIHALSEVTVSGIIQGIDGNKLTEFNGFVYPKVYDKPTKYRTLGNDPRSIPEDFYLSDKILFDGKISVLHGEFSFSFLVPKDIAYEYGFGEINYYAVDTVNFMDAWGAYEQIFIGGIDESAENDNIGPDILLYLDSKKFQNGQTTTAQPLLMAELFDNYGISHTGQSLGRDLVMVLDDDNANSLVVNEYFNIDNDTYKSGSLNYQFENLENGWHTISLKAWDLQNNSSEQTIDFYVDEQAEILLAELINYPNPFINETKFGFIHNKNNTILSVQILIYDMNGRFIGELNEKLGSVGDQITPLVWNGLNQNGSKVLPGVYTYNIIVTDSYGNQSIQRQKMIKLSE